MYEGVLMKRFKDLTDKQKRQAVDYMFERGFNTIRHSSNVTDSIVDRITDIKQRIKFCGCIDCDINLFSEMKKDSAIKELILEQAKDQAERAYYPEDEDTLIKVK